MRMEERRVQLRACLAALAAAFFLLDAAWADDYDRVAKSIAQASDREGFRHIAVLPFIASQGSPADQGWRLSEELVGRLVQSGSQIIVERSLLAQLLEEQRLEGLGMSVPIGRARTGRLLNVDGIVTGTILWADGKAVANVRLINVVTGEIVCAGILRLGRWVDRDRVPAEDYRDAVAAGSAAENSLCKTIRPYADELERRTLDVQARFWARHLRRGEHLVGAEPFPGDAISDPDLRQDLYDLIHKWYAVTFIPTPTQTELDRMAMTERTTAWLHELCEGGS